VYKDLRNIKTQLGEITEEVDNALENQPPQTVPKWRIQVRSIKKPIIKGPFKKTVH
jgi:hypothetical protein